MDQKYLKPNRFYVELEHKIRKLYGETPTSATAQQVYKALCAVVVDILDEMHQTTNRVTEEEGAKEVYYLSMEFLVGKSLRNNLCNLGLEDVARDAINVCGISLEQLYDIEPDAGLGNGGLGRLAACYLDGLATCRYPASGYSILYQYGIFSQKIENKRQIELPDNWLPGGRVWLTEKRDETVEVKFGGEILEQWYGHYHHAEHINYDTVLAVPYDMYISAYDSPCVNKLRLWRAESPGIDMESFNRGDYAAAMLKNSTAELISKILYPNDNQIDGKLLRLRQQYFLSCASVQDIVSKHLERYGNLDLLPEKVAIHINDTHPTLAIPELIRILLDECGYGWDEAFSIARRTFAYTNHTLMSEALEKWGKDLLKTAIPRIYEIIEEIDKTMIREFESAHCEIREDMRILSGNEIRMANICAFVCHSVNGVSKLHSDIVRDSLFSGFSKKDYDKFCAVTNGIAYRRWLLQGNPELTNLIDEICGSEFKHDASQLSKLMAAKDDLKVLQALAAIKHNNKERLAQYAKDFVHEPIDPNSIFDIQAKRFHEYKRQHLNVLAIVRKYLDIISGQAEYLPRTYFFGGKAAPGYAIAKQILHMVCCLGDVLEKDARTKDLLRVVFLPDFRVSMSEVLMPAAELSEQISLAGTEASGTGNMKLMLNGALTIGTLDGANVEIREAAGAENFFLFGMTKEQVQAEKGSYSPHNIYASNARIAEVLDFIDQGHLGDDFKELVANLKYQDPYMVLRDFDSYFEAQKQTDLAYSDVAKWNQMSLANIANAGIFSADRSVRDYANMIWDVQPLMTLHD